MFSLPLDATQRKPQPDAEVPEQRENFAAFARWVIPEVSSPIVMDWDISTASALCRGVAVVVVCA
jgi:hypothetical protein